MKKNIRNQSSLRRYYSQNGEDYLLFKFFDFKEQGYFVDVGAFDGVHLSNSYAFEKAGWNGICVEPQKFYYNLCKKNRPNSICISSACVSDNNITEIMIEKDLTGLFSSNRFDEKAPNISGHYNELGFKKSRVTKEMVNASTLNKIFENVITQDRLIDFISIDVEGLEIEVLKGLDLKLYRPTVLVLETNDEHNKKEVDDYLKKQNYLFAKKVRMNSFYVQNTDDQKKLAGISINCVIEKQMHPLGYEYTINRYAAGKVLHNGHDIYKLLRNTQRESQSLPHLNEKIHEYQNKLKKFDNWILDYKNLVIKKNEEIRGLKNEIEINQRNLLKCKQKIENLGGNADEIKLYPGLTQEKRYYTAFHSLYKIVKKISNYLKRK